MPGTDIPGRGVYTAALLKCPRASGDSAANTSRIYRDSFSDNYSESTCMARALEFLVNHWILSGLWIVLVILLIGYLRSKAGKSLTTQQAILLVNRHNAIVVDIRERKDFDKGHIVDAVNIPLAKLQERIVELDKKKDQPVIVVCQMGHHSGEAVKMLQARGFTQVSKMSGGMAEWQGQSLPIVR